MPKRVLDVTPVYYVYVLLNWRAQPFYVGKGKGRRAHSHCKTSDKRNWLKNEMIELTWSALDEVPIVIVNDAMTERQAFETEIALIRALGRIDNGTGILTNMTDGGEGVSGRIYSDNAKAAISAKSKERMMALTPQQRSQIFVNMWAAKTPEERSQIARDRCAAMGPEQLRARAIKIN